jgi:hypothetical protein
MRGTIESFSHGDAAHFFASAATEPNVLDPVVLSSIDAAGALVASPTVALNDLAAKLAELGRSNTVYRTIATTLGPLNQTRRTRAGAYGAAAIPARRRA